MRITSRQGQQNQPERPRTPLPLPTVAGYRILRPLGRGGMATVYLALQNSLDREVAIKVMAPEASADEAQAQRFEHEARIIAKLEHPTIVGIHEVGRTGEGQLYYVMPYLSRGDLGQRHLADDEARVLEIIRALLEALGYAHARGIVHRDVKAENVLFDNSDRPLLADFGIALSRRGGSARITSDGLALGSGGYMSPEQARGEEVDGRADIYSVGVLTYELLTGELPYQASDPLTLALMHAQDPIPLLPPERSHWQPFIDRAMAKQPKRRFRNSQAMLRALLALEPRVKPATRWSRMWALTLRNPSLRKPWVLVGLGLVLAFGLGYFGLRMDGSEPDVATARNPLPVPEVEVLDEEQLVRLQRLLDEGEAQLAVGDLVVPAGANAAESFIAALQIDPASDLAAAGLDRVFDGLATGIASAISDGDDDSARARFDQARLLADFGELEQRPGWLRLQLTLGVELERRMQRAIDGLDRSAGERAIALADRFGLQDPRLQALRESVEQLPRPGDLLRESGGPELVFVPAALDQSRVDRPFAWMRGEIARVEYAVFAEETGRSGASCRDRLSPLRLFSRRDWRDPGFEQSPQEPVVCVSADDAQAYAAWLSRRTGARYRLPTLGEWRHAAEATSGTPACRLGNLASSAGGCSDRFTHTAPTRQFGADRLSVFDMVGNAAEWTSTCAAVGCSQRVAAGTSWRDPANANPRARVEELAGERGYDDVGFRLLREVTAASLPR